jgi:membrane-associated phospholipid phosphatase
MAAFHWIVNHRWAPLSSFMIVLSHGGAWTWVAAGGVLALASRRSGVFAGAYQSAMAIGFATLLADAVAKPFIDRTRPYLTFTHFSVLAGLQESASFPSTHAAASFAGAYALSRVFPQLKVPLWVVASLVVYSRVYVGVHYPLDTVGGAVVGLAAAAFVAGGTRWYSDQLAARDSPHSHVAR